MRADRLPWFVPMRIARPRRLHFSTRGMKAYRTGKMNVKESLNATTHTPAAAKVRNEDAVRFMGMLCALQTLLSLCR